MLANSVTRPLPLPASAPRRSSRAVGRFELPAAEPQPATMEGAAPVAGALALQEEAGRQSSPHLRRQSPQMQAAMALDDLRTLQAALLAGAAGVSVAAALTDVAALPVAADPRLEEVLRGIRLRARLELARASGRRVSPD